MAISRIILLVAAALVLSSSLQAQEDAGNNSRAVQGTVFGRSGEPVAGAVVELENTRDLAVRSFITQRDGRYHFEELFTNLDYRIRAMYRGVFGPVKNLSRFNGRKDPTVNLKVASAR